MTIATAVTKPRSSARLRTTSIKPRRNRPNSRAMTPTYTSRFITEMWRPNHCAHLKRNYSRYRYAYLVSAVVGKVRVVEEVINGLPYEERKRCLWGYVQLS